MRYILSYDLHKPEQDYKELHEELQEWNAEPLLNSQWLLRRSGLHAGLIRDYFRQFLDAEDGIIVTGLDNNDWSAHNSITRLGWF